jgi:triosephosphate isomerase
MKPLIVANWKMNPITLAEAKQLFNSVKKGIKNIKNVEIVICPPFVYLSNFQISNSNFKLGAQDCFYEQKGPFTGEISPKMLKNLGCRYVILGHSERRKLGETDQMINKKIKAALKTGLKPILCLGDKSRKSKKDIKEVLSQLKNCLKGIKKSDFKNIILTYEPVWAVGTGRPCDYREAKKAKEFIKKYVPLYLPILYGGSVNAGNAANYIKEAGFQGLLIGGASLNPREFIKIISSLTRI